MDGILYVIDAQNKKRFQIDLDKYGELWEDFYDILVAESRCEEESIPYSLVKVELRSDRKI